MSSTRSSAKDSRSLPAIKAPITDNYNDAALPTGDFLSVKQAAAILNISYGSVLAAIHTGAGGLPIWSPRRHVPRPARRFTGLRCFGPHQAKQPPQGETDRLRFPEARR